MIVSFRDNWLCDFFVKDVRSKKIPRDLEARLFRKIQMIDDAATEGDLRVPPRQSFRKAAWQSSGLAFDPHQQAMATRLSLGRRPGRSNRSLSG
jgi:plasmid maintenance system killer protein